MQRLIPLLVAFSLIYGQEIQPLLSVNVARYRAVGTLNITCTGVGTTSAPSAINSIMYDLTNNATIGSYNGTFYNNDGSFTRVVQQLNSSSNAGALSNFLAVSLRNSGERALDRVVFLTRYDTVGGFLNAANCTSETVNATYNVNFEASYGFYRSVQPPVTLAGNLRTSARALGTLQYTCTNNAFVGPSNISSILYTLNETNAVGVYNGSFVWNDGSVTAVTAGSATNYNIAPRAALAYFFARASPVTGDRVLDQVSFITRYDTVGGVATPTDICTSVNEGQVITKNFAASYSFYAAAIDSQSSSSQITNTNSNTGSSSQSSQTSSQSSNSNTAVTPVTTTSSAALCVASFLSIVVLLLSF